MGGTSCHYTYPDTGGNGCTSSPNESILSAGAIVGIVLGSLIGIALIISLLVISYKLLKKNYSLPHPPRHMNVYGIRMNMPDQPQPPRPSSTHITKQHSHPNAPPPYEYYENA